MAADGFNACLVRSTTDRGYGSRRMTARKNKSDRARDLNKKHPDMTATEIAKRVGMSRQGVDAALAADPDDIGGRPRIGVDCPHCNGTGRIVERTE